MKTLQERAKEYAEESYDDLNYRQFAEGSIIKGINLCHAKVLEVIDGMITRAANNNAIVKEFVLQEVKVKLNELIK